LKDDTTNRKRYKKEIENDVLIPRQSFDDTTTRTRYTTEEIENDKQTIDSKKRHEEERRVKPDEACAFEEKGYTH
jgi:hypothetical protein